MAYDGFYGGLSTRATVSEILNLAYQVKEESEAILEEIKDIQAQMESEIASAEEILYLPIKAADITTTGGFTIDLNTANKTSAFKVTLNGPGACAFSNTAFMAGRWRSFELHLVQGNGTGDVTSWPNSVRWNTGGGPPEINKTTGVITRITFVSLDSGATWVGQYPRKFRTVSTQAPSGVAREGDEWIVVS